MQLNDIHHFQVYGDKVNNYDLLIWMGVFPFSIPQFMFYANYRNIIVLNGLGIFKIFTYKFGSSTFRD